MKLESLCYRDNVRADVVWGNDVDTSGDDWRQEANPYTVTLKRKRRQIVTPFWTGTAWTTDPTAADVLSSLLLDARCGEMSFEDYCGEFGYDTDSRKDYATWKQCQETALKVRKFLGDNFNEYANAEH